MGSNPVWGTRFFMIGVSVSGRLAVSKTVNVGSNPATPAKKFSKKSSEPLDKTEF